MIVFSAALHFLLVDLLAAVHQLAGGVVPEHVAGGGATADAASAIASPVRTATGLSGTSGFRPCGRGMSPEGGNDKPGVLAGNIVEDEQDVCATLKSPACAARIAESRTTNEPAELIVRYRLPLESSR